MTASIGTVALMNSFANADFSMLGVIAVGTAGEEAVFNLEQVWRARENLAGEIYSPPPFLPRPCQNIIGGG